MAMASSTDYSAKLDLTTCSICLETFKTPKYFPCLHSFCEGCIKTYITTTFVQTKGGVNCPVCRMYISKPNDIGIEEWSSKLPTNHILVSLIDMNESKSGEKLCMACARENETESASSWCINCAEALCKSCERYHRRNKFLSNHKVVDIENYGTTELPFNHKDIQCTEHPDKNVEVFCRDHAAICCMTCAFLQHRNCKNIGSIHDAAEDMKKSKEVESFQCDLKEFQDTLDTLLQRTSGNLQEFDKDIEKMKEDVDTLFIKLSDHLSQLKSYIMSEISKIEKEVRPEIEDKHDEIKCKISTIENDLALFQTNMNYAPPAQFLQAMEKLMEQRSILEQFVNEESQKLKEIRVTFDANEKLLQIEKDIKVFGEVNIRRASRTDMLRSTGKQVDMSSVVPTLSSEVNIQDAVTGISVLENGLVLLSTYDRQTIELHDHQCSSVLSSLSLPGYPRGIKMSSDTEGAVAVERHGLIIFNIQNNQITEIKGIRTNVNHDFVYHQGKYYIGCNKNIAVYDSNHCKVRDISVDNDVGGMAVRDDTSLCNNTIELRDHQCSSVLSSLSLPGYTWGIKMTSDTEGAVAVYGHGLIIFNIQNNQITKIKEIRTNVNRDFVYHQGKYYIGCNKNIAVYDSNHHKVRDISVDNIVGYMAVRDDTSLCYTVWGGRALYCISMDGTPVFTYSHDKLQYTIGVTVDHAGYIYVCVHHSRNVHQLSHDGKLQRIIFDNLPSYQYCVSFNKHGDKAVIGCDGKVLLYDME